MLLAGIHLANVLPFEGLRSPGRAPVPLPSSFVALAL
eukprot:SAG11_NODE_29668_length_308_cov_1.229665_1_plen_36_part_10